MRERLEHLAARGGAASRAGSGAGMIGIYLFAWVVFPALMLVLSRRRGAAGSGGGRAGERARRC